jgi:hypothetical protein
VPTLWASPRLPMSSPIRHRVKPLKAPGHGALRPLLAQNHCRGLMFHLRLIWRGPLCARAAKLRTSCAEIIWGTWHTNQPFYHGPIALPTKLGCGEFCRTLFHWTRATNAKRQRRSGGFVVEPALMLKDRTRASVTSVPVMQNRAIAGEAMHHSVCRLRYTGSGTAARKSAPLRSDR